MKITNKRTGLQYEVTQQQAERIRKSTIGKLYDIPVITQAAPVPAMQIPLTEKPNVRETEAEPEQDENVNDSHNE